MATQWTLISEINGARNRQGVYTSLPGCQRYEDEFAGIIRSLKPQTPAAVAAAAAGGAGLERKQPLHFNMSQ